MHAGRGNGRQSARVTVGQRERERGRRVNHPFLMIDERGRACRTGGLDGFTAAAATCSALGIASSLARRRPEPAQPAASPADADDGFFGWFLAAFLSLVPLANWTVRFRMYLPRPSSLHFMQSPLSL